MDKRKTRFSGQGMVEFALVIPILLIIVLGIFEGGRALWIYSAVTNASREAARLGSSVSDNGSGTPYYLDCVAIQNEAITIGNPGLVTVADISITYDSGPGTTSKGSCGSVSAAQIVQGDRVIVAVTGHYQPSSAIPLIRLPGFDIDSITSRTIVKDVQLNQLVSTSTAGGGATATTGGGGGATNTATNAPTLTYTPTPTDACQVTNGALSVFGSSLYMNITNNHGSTILITSVAVNWNDSPSSQTLDRMYRSGVLFWDGNVTSPPTTVSGGWYGASSRRQIAAGATNQLRVLFTNTLTASGHSVSVTFDNGCTVGASIGGSSATATPTPTLTPTQTPTLAPSNTASPTSGSGLPAAPIYVNTTWSAQGSICHWPIITVGSNSSWSSNPGSGPSNYRVFYGGAQIDTIVSNYPGTAQKQTWVDMPNGETRTYSFEGVFNNWSLFGDWLDVTLRCNNGNLIVTHSP